MPVRCRVIRHWPVSILATAAAILIAQGAGSSAAVDIFQYGRALATDTLPEPNAPLAILRPITGNADPSGRLPWPFGTTDYLVWWGTGSWPLWLVSIPALVYLLLNAATDARAARGRGMDSRRLGPGGSPRSCTGRTTTSCRLPARRSPWRFVWPTRLSAYARDRAAQPTRSAREHSSRPESR